MTVKNENANVKLPTQFQTFPEVFGTHLVGVI